jgi:tRNA (mo5U34)-methyltransferase
MVETQQLSSSPLPAELPESDFWWRQFERLLSLHLPDLTGKTVLDVGASDGYFSFAAERFGASQVLALDTSAGRQPGGRDRFEHVRRSLSSSVECLEVDVREISPHSVGQFDVVLFIGALDHTPHPLMVLERLASVTRELLVVETLVDMTFLHSPAAAFYPQRTLSDQTSWWGPNRAAVIGMLHTVGFAQVTSYPLERVSAARLVGLPARARIAAGLVSSSPRGSRMRLVRELARGVLTQSRLVTHGRAQQTALSAASTSG